MNEMVLNIETQRYRDDADGDKITEASPVSGITKAKPLCSISTGIENSVPQCLCVQIRNI